MKIHIYHTNDIHGDYDFLKRLHGYFTANRGENDLYFDSGDFTDLKNLVVQADRGVSAMELLCTCGLDAMAVGNNEIDLGSEDLEKLSAFPLLSANVTYKDDTPLEKIAPAMLLHHCGVRFLMIGLSPYYGYGMIPGKYNLFYEMGNLRTCDPIPNVRRMLDQYRGQYDYAVMLSHSGSDADAFFRPQLPEIDLWLGGHTHEILTELNYSQSGKGEMLGCITLEIGNGKPQIIDSVQIELPDCDNPEFDALLAGAERKADAVLARELETVGELAFDPFAESPLTNFLCDCLHKCFGGDLAVMHSGISEGPLTRPVSRKSLILNFPSKLNPTMYSIEGEKLLEAAKLSLQENYIRTDGKGPGFRGTVLGCLGYSCNVTVTKEPFSMCIDGKPVEPGRRYAIVTDDYLQRGTGYPSLQVPDSEAKFDKWYIRDLVQHCLTDAECFRTAGIVRIKERG